MAPVCVSKPSGPASRVRRAVCKEEIAEGRKKSSPLLWQMKASGQYHLGKAG